MSKEDDGLYITPKQIRERENLVEQILDLMDSDDQFLAGILANQVTIGNQLRNLSIPSQPSGAQEFDVNNLALGTVGVALEDIDSNSKGDVLFRPAGSEVIDRVEAETNVEFGQPVKVTGSQNKVSPLLSGSGIVQGTLFEDLFTFDGKFYSLPNAVQKGKAVKVGNQSYVRGNYTDNDSTINANSTETLAKVEVQTNQFFLFDKTAVTGNSNLNYTYEIDGDKDKSLSGPSPWAEPPNLHEVVDDGYMIVDNKVVVKVTNDSGSNVNDIEADVTGIIVNKKR